MQCYSSCLRFADLSGDGENRMIIANLHDRSLRVFKGMSVQGPEQTLLETPVSVCPFYMENKGFGGGAGMGGMAMRQQPALGVAAGPFVFIYRNMRPYGKFTVPQVEVASEELAVWRALRSGRLRADGPPNPVTGGPGNSNSNSNANNPSAVEQLVALRMFDEDRLNFDAALQMDPIVGSPQRWAQNCFYVCTYAGFPRRPELLSQARSQGQGRTAMAWPGPLALR